MNPLTLAYAQESDRDDPLKAFRSRFRLPGDRLIYLDGNSLGVLPDGVADGLRQTADHAWGERLIRSWNEDWYTKSTELGDRIALIAGASPGEVVVSDSTSVNLYKLVYAALRLQKGRTRVITDDLNFPSDVYILKGLVEQFGPEYELVVLESRDGMTIGMDQLDQAVDERTALVSLSHVVFKSAFRYPMKAVTELVHARGGMVLWDLSHSIGSVPGELNGAGADLAVGCSYKYLNGGPGAPAFLYVKRSLQDKLESPIRGWFGEQDPFAFGLDYKPAAGIRRFLAGTPPILSMIPLTYSVEILIEAGMERIRKKSEQQSAYLLSLAEALLYRHGFSSGSPVDVTSRGSHVSLRHPEAYRICKALIDPGTGAFEIIPDFREPDNIRLGITPLYTRFEDIFHTVKEMEMIVKEGLYLGFSDRREQVT